jgi:hypothetical protein
MVKRTSGFENANEENDIIYLDKTKNFEGIRESESFLQDELDQTLKRK